MLSNNIDRTPEGVLTFAGYDVTQLAKEYTVRQQGGVL